MSGQRPKIGGNWPLTGPYLQRCSYMWYLNFLRAFLFHFIMKSVNLEKHGWIEVDVLMSFTVGISRSLVVIIMILNLFLRNCRSMKSVASYFQLEPLPEVLNIASLQHTTNSIQACAESEFKLYWIKPLNHGATVFHFQHAIKIARKFPTNLELYAGLELWDFQI